MVEKDKFPIGCILTDVILVENQIFTGDELCFEEVQLLFREINTALVLRPIIDTDEIEFTYQPILVSEMINIPDWCVPFLGKKLQTVWRCKNAQGYQDQLSFAFDFLQPSLAFIAEGSTLKVFCYKQIKKTVK